MIAKLESVFYEISLVVKSVYEKEQTVYQRKLDEFYCSYNEVGDELRESLLTIIEESIDIKLFDPASIIR